MEGKKKSEEHKPSSVWKELLGWENYMLYDDTVLFYSISKKGEEIKTDNYLSMPTVRVDGRIRIYDTHLAFQLGQGPAFSRRQLLILVCTRRTQCDQGCMGQPHSDGPPQQPFSMSPLK